MEANSKSNSVFVNFIKYSLLILGIGIFLFAMIMGAGDYGGGISGLIKNAPNAWPWAILLTFILISWKNELTGGILVTLYGLGLVWFFNFSGPNFWWSTFFLTLVFPLLGVALSLAGYQKNR